MNIKNYFTQKITIGGSLFKFIVIVALLTISITGRSQSDFSLGFSVGYDKSFYQFEFMPKTNLDEFPDYNFGVDGVWNATDWLRVKLQLHYSNLGFTRYWNNESTDQDAIDLSQVAISNIDICPKADLKFLQLGNLNLYGSVGFAFEFQTGKWEKSLTKAGEEMDDDHVLDEYNEGKAGVVGGLVIKYNINPKLAITLSPDYTYFFTPYVFQSEYDDEYEYEFLWMDFNKIDLRRASFNIGLEWTF